MESGNQSSAKAKIDNKKCATCRKKIGIICFQCQLQKMENNFLPKCYSMHRH